MAFTNAQRQASSRARQAAKLSTMQSALEQIATGLSETQTDLGRKLLAIARTGLGQAITRENGND